MSKRVRKMDPNSLPNRALKFMKVPGTLMVSSRLGKLLGIDGRKASMLLAALKMNYPDMVDRKAILNAKESQPRWQYFIVEKPIEHRPDLWRADGILRMLAALDQNVRMRQETNGNRSHIH